MEHLADDEDLEITGDLLSHLELVCHVLRTTSDWGKSAAVRKYVVEAEKVTERAREKWA